MNRQPNLPSHLKQLDKEEEEQQLQQKILETNDNENTTIQTLWDAAKAVLRGKFIAVQSYLKKQEKHRINNLYT